LRVKIVPSTLDGRHQLLTSYLVNETVAIDAGAIAIGMSIEEQLRLRAIVITHAHLDHIISLPIFITDLFDELREPIELFATPSDFAAMREHLFNPRVWIPFEILKNQHTELLIHRPDHPSESFQVEGLRITPIPVSHTVLTHAMLVEDDQSAVLFTSDTSATEKIWQIANECEKLRAVLIDLSFPSQLTQLAHISHHHSTTTLYEEMEKLRPGVTVYAIHLKTPYRERIIEEIAAHGDPRLVVAEVGREYEF
jgi:ribonuclease BN (tRNA processing enzyme)